MLRQALILFFLNQVAIQENLINPFALLDDAKTALDTLRATVLGTIFVAEDNLDNLGTDLQLYGRDAEIEASITIQTEQEIISQELGVIKNLAQSAEVDISYCLRGREEFLESLPGAIFTDLAQCISNEALEGVKIQTNAKYLIDITINRVDSIEFQLGLCDPNSDGCISPLLQQIEREREQLPLNINVEVLRATDLFDQLKVSVRECSDLSVSQYVSSANIILSDISSCVNSVLG